MWRCAKRCWAIARTSNENQRRWTREDMLTTKDKPSCLLSVSIVLCVLTVNAECGTKSNCKQWNRFKVAIYRASVLIRKGMRNRWMMMMDSDRNRLKTRPLNKLGTERNRFSIEAAESCSIHINLITMESRNPRRAQLGGNFLDKSLCVQIFTWRQTVPERNRQSSRKNETRNWKCFIW